jgi:uncharacterized membrane protein YwzB
MLNPWQYQEIKYDEPEIKKPKSQISILKILNRSLISFLTLSFHTDYITVSSNYPVQLHSRNLATEKVGLERSRT